MSGKASRSAEKKRAVADSDASAHGGLWPRLPLPVQLAAAAFLSPRDAARLQTVSKCGRALCELVFESLQQFSTRDANHWDAASLTLMVRCSTRLRHLHFYSDWPVQEKHLARFSQQLRLGSKSAVALWTHVLTRSQATLRSALVSVSHTPRLLPLLAGCPLLERLPRQWSEFAARTYDEGEAVFDDESEAVCDGMRAALTQVVAQCGELRRLALTCDVDFGVVDPQLLVQLVSVRPLEELYLYACPPEHLRAAAGCGSALSALQSLRLVATWHAKTEDFLAALGAMLSRDCCGRSLQRLRVERLDSEWFTPLPEKAATWELPALTELHVPVECRAVIRAPRLATCVASFELASVLFPEPSASEAAGPDNKAAFPALTSLRVQQLDGESVLPPLQAIARHQSLTKLDLDWPDLSYASVIRFALARLPRLRWLRLGCTQLTGRPSAQVLDLIAATPAPSHPLPLEHLTCERLLQPGELKGLHLGSLASVQIENHVDCIQDVLQAAPRLCELRLHLVEGDDEIGFGFFLEDLGHLAQKRALGRALRRVVLAFGFEGTRVLDGAAARRKYAAQLKQHGLLALPQLLGVTVLRSGREDREPALEFAVDRAAQCFRVLE